MISPHPSFVWPIDQNVKIWRYTDLAKFTSLLFTSNLFFSRAAFLGDPYEGSIPKIQYELREYIIANRATDPNLKNWADIKDDQTLRDMFATEAKFREQSVKEFFVSCWHMNEQESAAMWRLYTLATEAVCIQSTFSRLASALPGYVNVGVVKYIDYDRDIIPADNLFNAVLHKRKSFSHEQEVRAVAWERLAGDKGGDEIQKNMNAGGLRISVNLQQLVERVYISPTASPWFEDVINYLVNANNLKVPVMKSSLAATPLY